MTRVRKTFELKGNGYVLMYSCAMDNSIRFEFFKEKEEAKEYAKKEIVDKEYLGLIGIMKVEDYEEWIF